MYKALFTADWHLSNSWPYAVPDENGITDRFKDQLNMIEQIGNIAEAEEVNDIFILGDLFDKSTLDAITLQYALAAIMQLAEKVSVYVLPGNHDAKNSKAQHYAVDFFRILEESEFDIDVNVLDNKTTIEIEDVVFHSIPWMPIDKTNEAISQIQFNKKLTNVVLLHQSVIGCRLNGSWVADEGIDAIKFGDHIYLAGHFHSPQEFNHGMYIGAPMQKDFGDAGEERRVVIGTFDDGEVEFEDRAIEAPRFYSYKFSNDSYDLVNPELKDGDYLRVQVESTHAVYKTRLEEAKEACSTYQKIGVNIFFQHIPVSDHSVRLKTNGPIDYLQAMKEYINISNTELDKKQLANIGKQLLESVKNA